MKALKTVLLIMIVLCVSSITKSQDVIVKSDHSIIVGKVKTISDKTIEYNRYGYKSIDVSEVLSIYYKNGEVEKFYSEDDSENMTNVNLHYNSKKLNIEKGTKLSLDGRIISNDEASFLLGNNAYIDYTNGQRFIKQSYLCEAGFMVFAIPAVYFLANGIGKKEFSSWNGSKFINNPTSAIITGVLCFGVSIPCLILYGHKNSIGNRLIVGIVNDYNENVKDYSINLTPSLINCDIPQLNTNYGIGITMSVNF